MGDDAQAYDEAYAVLEEIIADANYAPLFVAARQIKRMLNEELGLSANFQTDLQSRLSEAARKIQTR